MSRVQQKLQGARYRQYWAKRAAVQGDMYVGHVRMRTREELMAQADSFWKVIQPQLPDPAGVHVAVEFGCGWGRMTGRIKQHYADALVYGIDMVESSVNRGRALFPDVQFVHADHYPRNVPTADVLVTCTCLQHITDEELITAVISSFHARTATGTKLVLLEDTGGGNAAHMAGRQPADYIRLFRGFDFDPPVPLEPVFGNTGLVLLVGSRV